MVQNKYDKDDIDKTATTSRARQFLSIHTTTKINDTKHHLFKRIRFGATHEHLPQNINLNNKYNRRNGADIAIYSNNDKLVNNTINTDIETSREDFNKQLLQKNDETTEISVTLQTEMIRSIT